MNARDELAEVIANFRDDWYKVKRMSPAGIDRDEAAHLLAAGYSKPRQVSTVEELDALRFQAVVLDAYGTPYVCERHRTDGTRNEWRPAGMNHLDESETILYNGPAIVVHGGTK